MIIKKIRLFLILSMGLVLILMIYAGPKLYRKYSKYKTIQEWQINFPKKMELVDELPNPDSLYIFLMAGQSNMAGQAFIESQDTISNKRIITINKSMNWIYAKEPIHFYDKQYAGLDCGMSFAKKLIDSLPNGISIALIPCAVWGSSIEQWINNEEYWGIKLLDNFKSKVEFAEKYGEIKGILWHQGERNGNQISIPFYPQKLSSLIKIFRRIVDNDTLPIIMGELGSFAEPEERQIYWDSINSIIHSIEKDNNNISVVNTKDLTHIGDNLHFDSKSQRKLGERYAQKYLELVATGNSDYLGR